MLRKRGFELILDFGIRADWRQVPLLDALSFGCKSFEADIHLVGSGNDTDLLVSRAAVLVHPSELSFFFLTRDLSFSPGRAQDGQSLALEVAQLALSRYTPLAATFEWLSD